MLFSDLKNTSLRGYICRSESINEHNRYSISVKLEQHGNILDYALYYQSSDLRDADYRKLSKKNKL